MSSEISSTIGKQKRTNYAMLARSAEEFVHLLTDRLPARHEYFAWEVDYDPRIAARDFGELRDREPGNIAVLDVREPGEVAAGAIEHSTRIPLGELRSGMERLDREKLLVATARAVSAVRSRQACCVARGSATSPTSLADSAHGRRRALRMRFRPPPDFHTSR